MLQFSAGQFDQSGGVSDDLQRGHGLLEVACNAAITRHWLSTRKDRTLGSPSNAGDSGRGRTLVSWSDMIDSKKCRLGGCYRSEIASRLKLLN